MSNVLKIYDQYSSEDYLCNKTKPKGNLICVDCNNVYESYWDDAFECPACRSCGSMNEPYEED